MLEQVLPQGYDLLVVQGDNGVACFRSQGNWRMGGSETAGRCGDTHVRRGRGPVLDRSFPLFAHLRRFEVYFLSRSLWLAFFFFSKVGFTPLRVDRFRRRVP